MKEIIRLLLARLMARLLEFQSRPMPLAPGSVLFVAPHADDEALGGGGLLVKRSRNRLPTEVLFISDSAAPDPRYGSATRPEIAARRRGEALASLADLGMDPRAARFLDAPDGRLDRLSPSELDRVRRAMVAILGELQPRDIFVPFLGGGSSEHDAVYWIVGEAIRTAGLPSALWEYPVWAWWNPIRLQRQLDRPWENYRLELGGDRGRKAGAIARHGSQVALLPPSLARACTGKYEFFFRRHSP